jgi:hypothetical protein
MNEGKNTPKIKKDEKDETETDIIQNSDNNQVEEHIQQRDLPFEPSFIGDDDETEHEAANEKDEFYSLFKDNFILYDFVKGVNLRPEVFYPKKALGGFELYDKSIFEYQKGKGEGSSGSSSTRRKTKRKSTRRN